MNAYRRVMGILPPGLVLLLCALLFGASAVSAEDASPSPWFDALLDTRGLPPASVRALTELAAARLLNGGREEPPLDALRLDLEPRIVFLSVSSGKAPARVFIGRGLGVLMALQDALARVKIAPSAASARWLKLDLVQSVKRQEVAPKFPVGYERSLVGLAFERPHEVAFLPEVLVAETLLGSKHELRAGLIETYVRTAPGGGNARAGELSRLLEQPKVSLFRFWAASFFSDGSEVVELYRGHRFYESVTPEGLLSASRMAGDYLLRSIGDDGRFVYAYLPKTGEERPKYNILRHAGTTYSLLELYEVTRDEALLSGARRAINYLLKQIQPCEVRGVSAACVVEDDEVKLGGAGLAVVALAKHDQVSGEVRHSRQIRDLLRWVEAVQSESGEFTIHKLYHSTGRVSDFVSGYYPGEALLALVRAAHLEPRYLDVAEKGARWLVEVRDSKVTDKALNHDHWLLYALNELHRARARPFLLAHATRIAQVIMSAQNRRPAMRDWLGSYYRPPRSTPTATRSEGLAAAYRLLRDFGVKSEAERALRSLELGVRFQMQTQLDPASALYLEDPPRALGGFRRSLTNYEIRIDYVQHNISALLALRGILLERETSASP